MERLPKEVTKGKAATYKLVKLKKSVSYFDSTIRATQKFTHAITICGIPFLYLFQSKADDGRRGLYFSTALGVGQNIQYNGWWITEPTPKSQWSSSDFPAVNYNIATKDSFLKSISYVDHKLWPNAFWKKAFGKFTRYVHGSGDKGPMTFVDIFFLSCQSYTNLLADNKCLFNVMKQSMEDNVLPGDTALQCMSKGQIFTSPITTKSINIKGMKLLRSGEHTTHIRGNMAQIKAWVQFINTLSQDEWKYGGASFGIVNCKSFDAGGITFSEYIESLNDYSKRNFIGSIGAAVEYAALNPYLYHRKMNLDPPTYSTLWAGYLLSPANTVCDENGRWGGFTTPEKIEAKYASIPNPE